MKKHRHSALLAALMTAAMLVSLLPAALAADAGEKQITILGTSDMHANIWGYAYEDDKETANNGMARLYTYVEQTRGENPNTILVDGGDTIQGSILSDDIYNKKPDQPHPVLAAMNHMGYDAWTLGNHEFNFGLDALGKIMAQAEFPVLAANCTTKETGALFTGAGWTMVERDGVKVAVIGVTNPDAPIWDGEKVDPLDFSHMSDAVKACIAEIGDTADIIMVSAHAGLYPEFDEENGSDAAQRILDDNPEVDVLQVAHTHTTVSQTTDSGVLVGGARNGGREIVRFDLTLDANNNIVEKAVEIVDMSGVTPSQALRELPIVAQSHQATLDFIKGGGAGDAGEGGGVLGSTTEKFQPENEIRGIPAGRLADTAVMDLVNKVQLENSGADVSAAALFKDTSDLPAGEVNYGNIFNIYKFDNTLCRVPVTGAELKAYMEWSAACYNQWVPGDLSISFDPEYPDYLYDMFAGVDYEIDLSQPKGARIKNVTFNGQPLKDDQQLTLAVNNYRYSSALKSGGLVEGKKEWESPNSIRDMLVEYFAKNSPVAPSVDNNWKITGVDLQLDNSDRKVLVDLVNGGQLDSPYAESLNLDKCADVLAIAGNVVVDGAAHTASAFTAENGVTYYRLRDLACALNGTGLQFDVTWSGGVALTNGTAYTSDMLTLPARIPAGLANGGLTDLNAAVDGAERTVDAALLDGHYYVTAGSLGKLLNVDTAGAEADGVLTLVTK